jgi:hypothetical protein
MIKELDDVLLRDVGNVIKNSGKSVHNYYHQLIALLLCLLQMAADNRSFRSSCHIPPLS